MKLFERRLEDQKFKKLRQPSFQKNQFLILLTLPKNETY